MIDQLKVMFGKKVLGPSYPERPWVDENFQSNIPNLFIIGDISGTGLIKLAINQGHRMAKHIHSLLNVDKEAHSSANFQVVVIGCGCAGLGATRELHNLGIKYKAIDSGKPVQTIRNFTKGKPLFLEPTEVPFEGDWDLKEGTKESLLEEIDQILEKDAIEISTHEKVENITRKGELFHIETNRGTFTTKYVVLSIGKSGNPRKAGVPGETEYGEKIHHRLIDPDDYTNKNILIYGGGDVALEAAIALSSHNRVTLVTIDKEFIFPKKRNIEALKASSATIYMDTQLKAIGKDEVAIQEGKESKPKKLKNDVVFEMIGAELPLPFLKKTEIRLESDWTFKKWMGLIAFSLLIYCIYAWKKLYFPFNRTFLEGLPGILNKTSFWYSLLYTFLMIYFGRAAMIRWNKGGRDTYQTYRFLSLIVFQVISFLGIEIVASLFAGQFWWRFYGVNNPFPLLFDTFYNWAGVDGQILKWVILGLCLLVTFVLIPLSVRKHGKRFCTWICGCGGLAETFGDRWRHLSPKGIRSEKWEVVGTLIMFWAFTSAFVILIVYGGNTGASGIWHSAYALVVDFWLVAVIPVALYPFYGGKVWCRFWCPLAKYMQFLSKWYSTLQISSNDQCISCTECSRNCEVGVDVMKFAKNGEDFHNGNTSCIQCGICITVCPMDVLSFNNNRFEVKQSSLTTVE